MDQSVLTVSIVIVCVTIILAFIFSTLHRAKNLKMLLDEQFGQIPPSETVLKNIPDYWEAKLSHEDWAQYIDSITWDDLEMDKIFFRINSCQTSVGEEYLYAMLHEPQFDPSVLSSRERLITLLDSDPKFRLELQVILFKMGKSDANGLASLHYDISAKKTRYPWIFRCLALLPVIMLGIVFFNGVIGGIGLIASIITNGLVYYLTKIHIERELSAIRYFSSMLWCAKKIGKICAPGSSPILDDLASGFHVFKKLGGKLSGMAKQNFTDMDFLIEYIRILFLTNIRNYNTVMNMVENNKEAFRLLYKSFGELDAAISILSFRKSLPFYALPGFKPRNTILMEEIYHPLLPQPVLNSAVLSKSNLVSGSNASGKSTFIKAVAANAILAQTIHTCTARRFETRPSLVITSMAARDNITAGESYFITEIKSLKRIIEKISEVYCICVIDEILKGTNTIERIAASASVLGYLHRQDCLCIVATHDIELTRLLSNEYDNYHFSEQIQNKGIYFDYTIKQGPSETRNAIKLLSFLGFEDGIVTDANKLVQTFEETKTWS